MPTRRKLSPKITPILVLIPVLLISLIANAFFLKQNYDRNNVTKVIDGDSFELADGRRIRLMSVDAPEKDRCFHTESRTFLDSLIYDKNVEIKDTITDDYGRQLANVYVHGELVNLKALEGGFTRFVYTKNPYYNEMKRATQTAKDQKLGIYSPVCQNKDPVSDCTIKGNIKNGKIYHLPSCRSYKLVIIDESFGDQWFCTEKEANDAGFRIAKECK